MSFGRRRGNLTVLVAARKLVTLSAAKGLLYALFPRNSRPFAALRVTIHLLPPMRLSACRRPQLGQELFQFGGQCSHEAQRQSRARMRELDGGCMQEVAIKGQRGSCRLPVAS